MAVKFINKGLPGIKDSVKETEYFMRYAQDYANTHTSQTAENLNIYRQ